MAGCVHAACATAVHSVLQTLLPFRGNLLSGSFLAQHCHTTGTVLAIGAAVTTALAFLAVGAIPKSEPALIVAMWVHGSSLLTAAIALTVGLLVYLTEAYRNMAVPRLAVTPRGASNT